MTNFSENCECLMAIAEDLRRCLGLLSTLRAGELFAEDIGYRVEDLAALGGFSPGKAIQPAYGYPKEEGFSLALAILSSACEEAEALPEAESIAFLLRESEHQMHVYYEEMRERR